MNIENEVFKRTSVNFKQLEKYGFKKEKNIYIFEKKFLNNEFKAIINIDDKGLVSGKVIDLQVDEEYTNIRTKMTGEFVNNVRESYKNILIDIRKHCFETDYFINGQANRINKYIKEKYNNEPEFLWDKFPGYGVYRNENNNKWYGIIMNLDLSKLDNGSGEVEIINVKLAENKVKKLLKEKGFYEAYHMSKTDWISIILNDTLKDEEIVSLLDESYNLISEPEDWIVPANPKYYDVINCFNNTDEIIWKQSSDIHINDTVYLYVADPYSKIMYKCKAIEVNIPYEYKDKNVSMNHVMRIKLIKRLDNKEYTFEFLNKLGIKAIRGPRKIAKDISEKLK
ncbi:MAG: MmcQ/YjbR family DNA-binding protein [Bacilli bacterium]|nr:MmcQ/YjbR family DNA-binding protein [Bacilli bacterium]